MTISEAKLHQWDTLPFNPLCILSPDSKEVLHYSQSFALISGHHPSTFSIPVTSIMNSNLTFFRTILSGFPKLVFATPNRLSVLERGRLWGDLIIRELRTVSHAIELGTHLISKNYNQDIIQTMMKSSKRQKVATLIASDFIILLTSPPEIYSISLMELIQHSFNLLNLKRTHLNFHFPLNSANLKKNHPRLLGNYHFLKSSIKTLLNWLSDDDIILEINILNPVTVLISLSISDEFFLSELEGYPLIHPYISYIAAYFNGRAWLTQNTINLLFPLDLTLNSE